MNIHIIDMAGEPDGVVKSMGNLIDMAFCSCSVVLFSPDEKDLSSQEFVLKFNRNAHLSFACSWHSRTNIYQ